MIDFARIVVIAGDGGGGCGSFFRIKGKRYGKADGGDGGRGGDVYAEATRDLSTLESYRYVKNYKAENGGVGFSNNRRGADGSDLMLKVPVGTLVKVHSEEGIVNSQKLDTSHYSLITDLVNTADKVLVARGGEGGRGNAHLRDEYGHRPKVGERGQEGELVGVTLEMKLIADVGLVGLPNAGKSRLLAKLTAARPKIAAYPFTTLEPNLGVLTFSGPVIRKNLVVIADIPGLIEGASQGRGLGDLFLRHIERTKILVHLVDVSTSTDKWQDYQTIRDELKAYSEGKNLGFQVFDREAQNESAGTFVNLERGRENYGREAVGIYSRKLAKKLEIVVLTKVDLVDKKTVDVVVASFKKRRKKVIATSAETGEGLAELVSALQRAVAR